FLNFRGFAAQVTQVVELGAPYITATGNLDFVDIGRVDRERTFHADTETNLADRKCTSDARVLYLDPYDMEHLDTRAVTFDHLDVDLQRVAGPEFGDVFS